MEARSEPLGTSELLIRVTRMSLRVLSRYDCGKNNAGLAFGTAHPSFQTSFLKPFATFVKQVFREFFLIFQESEFNV
jgi:hypothetical protein